MDDMQQHTDHSPERLDALAQQLAGAEHPVMSADRMAQIEAQVLARAAMQKGRRHGQPHRTMRLARLTRWAVAASVMLVAGVLLVLALILAWDDAGSPHLVTPDNPANTTTDIQPVSAPVVTVREAGSSSVFVVPRGP